MRRLKIKLLQWLLADLMREVPLDQQYRIEESLHIIPICDNTLVVGNFVCRPLQRLVRYKWIGKGPVTEVNTGDGWKRI